jgi:Beta-galactosidase
MGNRRHQVLNLSLALCLIGCSLPGRPGAGAPAKPPPPPDGYLFGTLLSISDKAPLEYSRGIRVVHLELGWNLYEPEDGRFSSKYVAEVKDRLRAFRAIGMKVVLGVGLQYPPRWIFEYPNSRYVNQYGHTANILNLTFNQTLRERAERYIAQVAQDLDPTSFWAVRIGSGGLSEVLYPPERVGSDGDSYWAYDVAAQTGLDLPSTVPVSPYLGWKPGEDTYQNEPFSSTQVQQWYDWYLNALVDGVNWQITTYKRHGFTGYLQVLMPGLGSRPGEYAQAIDDHLGGGGNRNHTMGRGAVWHKVIDALSDRQNVVVYISSVADGSGNDDLCESGDPFVSLDNLAVSTWSATRWLSYNADRYGMLKMGENPGRGDTKNYGVEMMRLAARQVKACGLLGLMWAHDRDLYEPGSGVTLDDYAVNLVEYSEPDATR